MWLFEVLAIVALTLGFWAVAIRWLQSRPWDPD
jgi:hypothetical protein